MWPVEETGKREPLPTMMEEGVVEEGGWDEVRIPEVEAMWDEAPESIYHSCVGGGESCMVLKFYARVFWSHIQPVAEATGAGGPPTEGKPGCPPTGVKPGGP